MLGSLIQRARRIALKPDFEFEDYAQLFAGLDRAAVAGMFEEILRAILEAPEGRDQPYDDQVHLVSEGDFNLTLNLVGPGPAPDHVTASEFDMLAINLGDSPVTLPVYRTLLDTG